MSGLQYLRPVRAISGATISPGGLLEVRLAGTESLAALFADLGMSVPLANPMSADSGGYFPPVYLSSDVSYDVEITTLSGATIALVSDYNVTSVPLAIDAADPRSMSGALMPGATYTFFRAETTQLTTVFADEALTTPLDNPVVADVSGVFPDIWLDVETAFRVRLADGAGVLQFDIGQYLLRPGAVPPSAPELAGEVNVGVDAIDLSWSASVSPFDTIAGYRLYDADTDALIVDQVGLTYEFSPIAEGNSYSFYVVGYDASGLVSPHSNIVTISIAVTREVITSSRTWVKPDGLLSLTYSLIAAGGGGASGSHAVANGAARGGKGGGGGEWRGGTILASALGDTEDVVIGLGGDGGASVPSGNTNGNAGTDGGDSSFGTHAVANGGIGGTHPGGSGSAGGSGGSGGAGEDGGDGSAQNQDAPDVPGGSTSKSGPGGGGGGGHATGPDRHRPGAPGGSCDDGVEGSGGAAATSSSAAGGGQSGGDGTDDSAGGAGGGGGTGHISNPGGGIGGNGGSYGAGGGGGGAGLSSGGSGVGGDGAGGVLVLEYTYT